MKFYIYIWLKNKEHMEVEVSGVEAAYNFYRKAVELADLVGGYVDLVDGQTGEVIESSNEEDPSMITFINCTPAEQEIIRKAYDFEITAIEEESTERNPYAKAVQNMGLWEAFNKAVEMRYN